MCTNVNKLQRKNWRIFERTENFAYTTLLNLFVFWNLRSPNMRYSSRGSSGNSLSYHLESRGKVCVHSPEPTCGVSLGMLLWTLPSPDSTYGISLGMLLWNFKSPMRFLLIQMTTHSTQTVIHCSKTNNCINMYTGLSPFWINTNIFI